jgi:hypothetical protein
MMIWIGPRTNTTAQALPTIVVQPASQTINVDDAGVSVDVTLQGAADVSSFEFTLKYNPQVLELVSAENDSTFIGQAGPPICPAPIVDEKEGLVRLGCGTIGEGGASGTGRIGTMYFTPRAAGKSPLVFTKAELADSLAEDIPSEISEGIVRVLGEDENEPSESEPTPTRNPVLRTPTAITGAPTPDVIPAGDPNLTGSSTGDVAPRSGRSGTVRGSASSGSSGADAAGSDDDFPRAGHGPQNNSSPGWPRYAIIAALGGTAVLAAGLSQVSRKR